MADKTIDDLAELSAIDLNDNDVLAIVDVSTGVTKKIKRSSLLNIALSYLNDVAGDPTANNILLANGAAWISTPAQNLDELILPDYTGNDGKILSLVETSDGFQLQWTISPGDISSMFPALTGSSNLAVFVNATEDGFTYSNLPSSGGGFVSSETKTFTGRSVSFTDIPSGTKLFQIPFSALSTNGLSLIYVQLGDAGGFEVTGYSGASGFIGTTSGFTLNTIGLGISANSATPTNILHGVISGRLINPATNLWQLDACILNSFAALVYFGGCSKSLSQELTQIRFTTANGADLFDSGSGRLFYQ